MSFFHDFLLPLKSDPILFHVPESFLPEVQQSSEKALPFLLHIPSPLLLCLQFQFDHRTAEHPLRHRHLRPFLRTDPVFTEGIAGIIRLIHTLLDQFFACSFQFLLLC